MFQGYEFIGDQRLHRQDVRFFGSEPDAGNSAEDLRAGDHTLALFEDRSEESLRFLLSMTGILRQYFEFDKMYNDYKAGKANEHNADCYGILHLIGDREIKTVPMSLLVQLGSIVDFNVPMMETVFEKIGTPYKYEEFRYASGAVQSIGSTSVRRKLPTSCAAGETGIFTNTLTDDEKKEIALLYDYHKGRRIRRWIP